MKQKLSSFYSRLLAACLVLLGFGFCSTSCTKYGTPTGRYSVQGKVVSSEGEKTPIKDIRVVMIGDVSEDDFRYLEGDTTYTDSGGKFEFKGDYYFELQPNKFKVKFQDIDGEENGLFEDKEQTIVFKNSDFKGGHGQWDEGKAKKDMGRVELKPKKEDE